jgi:hypothetical protein
MSGWLVRSRAVVLVEGLSDQVALETLAARRGRDLARDGVSVIAMGGGAAVGRFVEELGPRGLNLRLAGLCDEDQELRLRRRLERAGVGAALTRPDLERLGFYVCVADLEDELIRALGTDAVERVIESEGDLRSFRSLQQQPAQVTRSLDRQLRRFMGSHGGRKIRYAQLLVDALDLGHVPRPLDAVLAHVQPG